MKPLHYFKSRAHHDLTLAVAFYDMAYIFKIYVKNEKAYKAARVVSFFYSVHLGFIGEIYQRLVLSRAVRPHEWHLCKSYGDKNGFIA